MNIWILDMDNKICRPYSPCNKIRYVSTKLYGRTDISVHGSKTSGLD